MKVCSERGRGPVLIGCVYMVISMLGLVDMHK